MDTRSQWHLEDAHEDLRRAADNVREELTGGNGLSFDRLENWIDAKIALAAAEGEGGS